ncbi:MAG TPA: DedA family protein [Vicinamibacterales bacterium]|nr:DedA family protein [Vicinamibacterales bacterium]
MEQQLLSWVSHYGAVALFGLLALGVVGVPVPNETLLTLAGALVRKGQLNLIPTLVGACAGNVLGVTLSYAIGRFAGDHYLKRHLKRGMDTLELWFERIGKWALMFGYFVPGIRHLTAIGAGSSGFPFPEFARYAYSGAILWTVLFFGFGYFIGAHLPASLEDVHNKALLACLVGALLVVGYELFRRHAPKSKAAQRSQGE